MTGALWFALGFGVALLLVALVAGIVVDYRERHSPDSTWEWEH